MNFKKIIIFFLALFLFVNMTAFSKGKKEKEVSQPKKVKVEKKLEKKAQKEAKKEAKQEIKKENVVTKAEKKAEKAMAKAELKKQKAEKKEAKATAKAEKKAEKIAEKEAVKTQKAEEKTAKATAKATEKSELKAQKEAEKEAKKEKVETKTVEEKNIEVRKPVVITFYKSDCADCKKQNVIFEKMKNNYSNDIDFYEIDMDDEDVDYQSLQAKYNVKKAPTTMFLNYNTNLTKKVSDYIPQELYLKYIKQLMK